MAAEDEKNEAVYRKLCRGYVYIYLPSRACNLGAMRAAKKKKTFVDCDPMKKYMSANEFKQLFIGHIVQGYCK